MNSYKILYKSLIERYGLVGLSHNQINAKIIWEESRPAIKATVNVDGLKKLIRLTEEKEGIRETIVISRGEMKKLRFFEKPKIVKLTSGTMLEIHNLTDKINEITNGSAIKLLEDSSWPFMSISEPEGKPIELEKYVKEMISGKNFVVDLTKRPESIGIEETVRKILHTINFFQGNGDFFRISEEKVNPTLEQTG